MRPMDLSKFRKSVTKTLDGISFGFNDPTTFISTGNYTLNYLISGDFKKGVPLGKVSMFAGESGSGKSYICSGNIVKNAQDQGIFVILIDTENALDEQWLKPLGVDTSEDKLLKVSMSMIDDVAKLISEFVKEYKSQYLDTPKEERPKYLFIIDSIGMLMTHTDIKQFNDGDLKGDMGRKPKALNALVKNCVSMFGELDIGLICTNHTYDSQNMFSPDPVISGGNGFIFASSIIIAMAKLKLKEDENGTKTSEVAGIRSKCKVTKTRYNKPFEEVEIKIPWDKGMDPYSGLFDLCLKTGFLIREGNSYIFTKKDGTIIKELRKNYTNDIYEDMMEAFPSWQEKHQFLIEKEEKNNEMEFDLINTSIDENNNN